MRWTVSAILVLLALLLLPANAPAGAATKSVSLTAKEFSFTPAKITVKVGQRLEIRLTNAGKMDHEFLSTVFKAAEDVEIKAEGVKVEADEVEEVEVEPGHTAIIELTPKRTGTFAFWCAEKFEGKLHRDLGMRGTITVTR